MVGAPRMQTVPPSGARGKLHMLVGVDAETNEARILMLGVICMGAQMTAVHQAKLYAEDALTTRRKFQKAIDVHRTLIVRLATVKGHGYCFVRESVTSEAVRKLYAGNAPT